jgi:myo-inositol 2-dehydrogenase/D-chiro-inositol 1-dehydrogenase
VATRVKSQLGVALIGTGYVSTLHAEALAANGRVRLVAVAGRDGAKAARFAAAHGVEQAASDWRVTIDRDDVDLVVIGVPNALHRDVAVAAASAGKHVVCEKPLARTMADADAMIEACRRAGVLLLYAECVCFAPRYQAVKRLVERGTLGRPFQARHSGTHRGPHSNWFWDAETAGGGAAMDMGCHGIELVRWLFGKPPLESVAAELGTFAHGERTRLEDHALLTLRFAGGQLGIVEASWATPRAFADRLELVGDESVTRADLLLTPGELPRQYGFHDQFHHFVACLLDDVEPRETGADGRVVLEALYAAYRSAATGCRVRLPLKLTAAEAAAPPVAQWPLRSFTEI